MERRGLFTREDSRTEPGGRRAQQGRDVKLPSGVVCKGSRALMAERGQNTEFWPPRAVGVQVGGRWAAHSLLLWGLAAGCPGYPPPAVAFRTRQPPEC